VSRFVALLRGVNVGKGKRVPMAALRQLLAALAKTLHVDVPVIVKSSSDIAAIQKENTLASIATEPSRLLVAFTATAADLNALAVLAPLSSPPEQLLVGKHAAYLRCPDGILKSRGADAMPGKAGRSATTRNWATVAKISALLHKGIAGKPSR
jgi:uncharacterized protein (DUF1697 family)